MSTTQVSSQNLPPAATTGAITQTSTNAAAVVTGTEIDATQWKTVCYTASVTVADVDWSVWGANVADYSDEVAVLAATKIASGSSGSYSALPAPFRYFRVKCIDDVGGVHGSIVVNGIAKAA